MKVEVTVRRGRPVVLLHVDEDDAIPLSTILSYAATGIGQSAEDEAKAERRVFNQLAAVCEGLSGDARTFAEQQDKGLSADYHKVRKLLDPDYEAPKKARTS